MEFTIVCPVDGEMSVGMESVENMVVHEEGHAEITFRCPQCGTHVTISAPVPAFLLSTMEAISKDLGIPVEDGKIIFNTIIGPQGTVPNQNLIQPEIDFKPRELTASDEAHMSYFRNQLDEIRTVEDFLAQFD